MKIAVRAGVAVVLFLAALVPVAAQDDPGGTVVVTRPGVVFHKAGGSDLRGRGFEKSLDTALQAGYRPCPICFGRQAGSAANLGPDFASGIALPSFAPEGIPAPPSSTVSQPFGLRAASPSRHVGRETFRNPFLLPDTIIDHGREQGAFETR